MDETTAPTRAVQAALDALADARVSASLVIVALVAFLAWRLVLRRHRLASAPARPGSVSVQFDSQIEIDDDPDPWT